jgi:hypothetical protein
MSAEPVPRVRQVGTIEDHRVAFDSSTGEVCPNCNVLHRDIDGLEADIRIKNRKIARLEEDTERKAENSEYWAAARELFHHWQIVCNRRRSPWSAQRFWEVEPFMRAKAFGPEKVRRAIDGIAYQSWVSQRTNGTVKWHTDWAKLFESPSSVEEGCNRAPRGWSLAWSAEMEHWPAARPEIKHVGGWFGIRPPAGWSPPAQETNTGQTALIAVVDND